MHLHILGICGTFMGGVAALARELGHEVSGQDKAAWPPMSTQLESLGIALHQGYSAAAIEALEPDLVIVGNAVSRGNPALEYVLERGLPYRSGPQWLAEAVLQSRWVLAVAGTHGKTTTASLLSHILEQAGLNPGFLIGGVPANFGVSARLGAAPFFVIEADEYDTAFCDKRSKFVHYRPRTVILNNLEFDHADIFPDLAAIETQFHHLVRTVPGNGQIIYPTHTPALARVLERGCWSETVPLGADTGSCVVPEQPDFQQFLLRHAGEEHRVDWPLRGQHNAENALAAVIAARHAGVTMAVATEALASFASVARRQTLIAEHAGIRIYDDFAHHPTAIAATLVALRPSTAGRLIAVLELRSNSMRAGVHTAAIPGALEQADRVHLLNPPDLGFDAASALGALGDKLQSHPDTHSLQTALVAELRNGDGVVLMSNGAFGGLPQSLPIALEQRP